MDIKFVIALVALVLTFGGYIPYVIDIFKERTKPHLFTWLIWTLAVSISAGLQIVGGAGAGTWTTIAVAGIALFILILCCKNGVAGITRSDVIFLILALVSLFLWLGVDQPVLSAILIVTTDILGFVPTIRKTWTNPHSETLSTYQITAIRHGLSILALQQYNILTLLYPITWTIANVAFSALIIVRRKNTVYDSIK